MAIWKMEECEGSARFESLAPLERTRGIEMTHFRKFKSGPKG